MANINNKTTKTPKMAEGRKCSFNMDADLFQLVRHWKKLHPGTKFTWRANLALKQSLLAELGKTA